MNSPSERLSKVKRPMASLKQLNKQLKLQSINPLKQLSNQLPKRKPSQTNRPQVSAPLDAGVPPSVAKQSNLKQSNLKQSNLKQSKGSQIAFNLLLVRPWVLVAGLWLVSMLGAAVAIEGMVSPRKLTMELPEPTAEITSVAKDSFINIEQGADDIAAADAETAPSAATPVAPADTGNNHSNFPAWPVGALVGTCAAGCLAISRQRARVRLAAARSRSVSRGEARGKIRKVRIDAEAPSRSNQSIQKGSDRKPVKTATSRSAAHLVKARASQSPTVRSTKSAQSTARATAPLDLRPVAHSSANQGQPKKRRPRPQPVMAAAPKSAAASSRVLASRSTAQRAAPTSRVSRPQPVKRVAAHAASRQSVVSVVPASEAHPLDWTEGSLAHKMDVRSQQSVSSL